MRVHKVNSRTKTVSSYLLSGINIKKMIADESDLAHDIPNLADATIIKINKRPIFKIIKEKEQQATELPSKTFKIRSFTRKLKRNGQEVAAQENNNEVFEKVQKLRHLKSVNNRIELFNLSAISKLHKKEVKEYRDNQKTENSEKDYRKMRQILVNNTQKWRATSQIIVKQLINEPLSTNNVGYKNPRFEYSQVDTEKYQQLASRISFKVNTEFKQVQQHTTLLIIALDSLRLNQRRIVKSSKIIADEQSKLEKYRGKFGPQVFQAIKLFTSKQHPFSAVNPSVKLAFKVNNAQQLEQLRQKLYLHQIDDYYCIFHINKKYSQIYNLYTLSPIFHNVTQLILIQSKSKLSHQFPVMSNTSCLLFATYNETLHTLRKLAAAIKSFLLCELSSDVEQSSTQRGESSLIFSHSNEYRQHNQIKYQEIPINTSELQARLRFALQSRNIKNQVVFKHQKQLKSHRRSALDDKTHSINNVSQSMSLQCDFQKREAKSIKNSISLLQERLLADLQMRQQMRQQSSFFKAVTAKSGNISHKNQQIDDITYNIKHGPTRSKPLNVEIADLVRRNEQIYKQVTAYIQKTNILDLKSFNSKDRHLSITQSRLSSLKCVKII